MHWSATEHSHQLDQTSSQLRDEQQRRKQLQTQLSELHDSNTELTAARDTAEKVCLASVECCCIQFTVGLIAAVGSLSALAVLLVYIYVDNVCLDDACYLYHFTLFKINISMFLTLQCVAIVAA